MAKITTTTPLRQIYFGEKPIRIEKNWKAWLGNPAELEKNLKEWTKTNLAQLALIKKQQTEINALKKEKITLNKSFETKEKDWEKERQDLIIQKDANNANYQKIIEQLNQTQDFDNKLLVYLGKHRTTIKPAISDLNSVKFWLRKEDKPMEELVDKDYYTLPELASVGRNNEITKLQKQTKEITKKYQELLTKIELLEL